MLTWGWFIIAFCYDVVYKLCDGLCDLLQIFARILRLNEGCFIFQLVLGISVLRFPRWVGCDLVMPRYLELSVLPLWWLLRACYVSWTGLPEISCNFVLF